jgi:hypothetical protein
MAKVRPARRRCGYARWVIVVVGRLDRPRTVEVARRAAASGRRAEIAATAPPGTTGDTQLAVLAAAGIGHAAVLRTPSASLDPADLELALRYLPDIRVVVVADDVAVLGATAAAAAAWAGAELILVTSATSFAPPGIDPRTTVLAGPSADPDGAFAGLVGQLAARLDAGTAIADAWDETLAALAIEPADAPVRPPRAAR